MRRHQIIITIIYLLLTSTLKAQYFGQNKVRYKKLDFHVVESHSFDTYNYIDNDSLIASFVKDAEKWKSRHHQIFKDSFAYKIPIMLYNNHADFQQTSVVGGLIGTSTGGVTEGLKNRVTMPLTPTYAQTDHVLGHELVHAHQYNLIKASDSLSFQNMANIPLWMTEGLAEYMSIGSKDEHTAMWLRDAIAYDYFPRVKDLYKSRYFPYRFGHAFWAFVGGSFGDDKIEKLYTETAFYGVKMSFKRQLGMSVDSFSNRWRTITENFYKPLIKDRALEGVGRKLIDETNAGRLNVSPAISPNGKYFIFLSEKEIFSLDLFLADVKTGKIIKKLRTKTRDSHLDAIDGFESAGTWASDSNRYAFTIYSKGKQKVVIADVNKNKVVEEFFIPNIPALENITWSPDGSKMVFTGLIDGYSNLYSINLKTKEVEQLTDDNYGQIQAQWSPDGKYLVFATDRQGLEFNKASHNMSIALLELETKEITYLPLFKGSNNLNPQFGFNGGVLYFLSDREGFRDIYEYNFKTKTILQLTKFVTGVSGITHLAPALSVSKENDLLYSLYQNSNYNIYKVKRLAIKPVADLTKEEVDHNAAKLPSTESGKDIVNQLLTEDTVNNQSNDMKDKPYRPQFKLDYISNGGVGVSTSRYGTGMVGGINMLFGDMLNQNQLYLGAVLNGELQDFGIQGAYLNNASRFGWGAGLSHVPYRFMSFSRGKETIDNKDYYKESLNVYRMFQEQASLFAYYPFSKIERVEVSTSSNYYSFRLDRMNYYYDPDVVNAYTGYYNYVGQSKDKNLDTGDPFFIQDFSVAYVGDDSSFGVTAPMKGYRYRLEAQQSFGQVNITSLVADARTYRFLNPISFSGRVLSYNRLGYDSSNRVYPPLYLGYETLIRGYTYTAFNRSQQYNGSSSLTFNDLLGSQMLVSSVELRVPFTGPERLSLIKSGFLFSDLNLFVDAGVAWGTHYETNNDNRVLVSRSLEDSSLIYSTGVSMRINLFGQLILEPYYAFPLSLKGNSSGVFGLNFTPGW